MIIKFKDLYPSSCDVDYPNPDNFAKVSEDFLHIEEKRTSDKYYKYKQLSNYNEEDAKYVLLENWIEKKKENNNIKLIEDKDFYIGIVLNSDGTYKINDVYLDLSLESELNKIYSEVPSLFNNICSFRVKCRALNDIKYEEKVGESKEDTEEKLRERLKRINLLNEGLTLNNTDEKYLETTETKKTLITEDLKKMNNMLKNVYKDDDFLLEK